MAKKNTGVIRANPEFERLIRKVMAKKLVKGKNIRTPRVTLAIARQYRKYPQLLNELMEADMP